MGDWELSFLVLSSNLKSKNCFGRCKFIMILTIFSLVNNLFISEFYLFGLVELKLFVLSNKIILMISLKWLAFLQRRCALEDWMEKLLSDIDLSRSVLVATFLELEASVRSGRCPDNASYYDTRM